MWNLAGFECRRLSTTTERVQTLSNKHSFLKGTPFHKGSLIAVKMHVYPNMWKSKYLTAVKPVSLQWINLSCVHSTTQTMIANIVSKKLTLKKNSILNFNQATIVCFDMILSTMNWNMLCITDVYDPNVKAFFDQHLLRQIVDFRTCSKNNWLVLPQDMWYLVLNWWRLHDELQHCNSHIKANETQMLA